MGRVRHLGRVLGSQVAGSQVHDAVLDVQAPRVGVQIVKLDDDPVARDDWEITYCSRDGWKLKPKVEESFRRREGPPEAWWERLDADAAMYDGRAEPEPRYVGAGYGRLAEVEREIRTQQAT